MGLTTMSTVLRARVGLAAEAYTAIRRDIVRCRLEPGLRISKAQLEQRYGLGHAAIRDALARLSQDGLVQIIPREAFIIAPMTLKQVHDIYDARLIVEPVAARLAAGRVDEQLLRRLDAEHFAHHDTSGDDELDARIRANTEFHVAIARASGNERVASIVESLHDELERYMHLSYILGEQLHLTPDPAHQELIAALIAGDDDRAELTMSNQIRNAKDYVVAALYASPSLQTVTLSLPPMSDLAG